MRTKKLIASNKPKALKVHTASDILDRMRDLELLIAEAGIKMSGSKSRLLGYDSQRGLAKYLNVAPTSAGRIAAELQLPFVVLRGRKLYRLSAVKDKLLEREQTGESRRNSKRRG